MILDLHTNRMCSVAALVRDAALGRTIWSETAAAIAGGIGVSRVAVERLSPLMGRPGVASLHTLHASRSFVGRWTKAFGDAFAVIQSSDQSHVVAYEIAALENYGEVAERLQEKLRATGSLCLGIDSESGFYALRAELPSHETAGFDGRGACLIARMN